MLQILLRSGGARARYDATKPDGADRRSGGAA
jgi:hypothetical protein